MGKCWERTPAPESGLALALPHSVLTWGPQAQPNGARRPERSARAHPGGAEVRDAPGRQGQDAWLWHGRPPTRGTLPSAAAPDRGPTGPAPLGVPGGGRARSWRRLGCLFLSLRARSCSHGVGVRGRGRGREARGGRRPAGASEEPGSGALAPTPPPRAQGAGGDRGEFGRRAQWGDGERKLFN